MAKMSDVALQSHLDQLAALEHEIAKAHPRNHTRSFTASLGILVLGLGGGAYDGWGWDLTALSVVLALIFVAWPFLKVRRLEHQRATLIADLPPENSLPDE